MWLKNFLQNFRLRIQARHNRRLEKRRTKNLLRLWRTETRRDRLRLFILLSPLQLLSRFLADSGAEENAKTDSSPAPPKHSKQIGTPTQSASGIAALSWRLRQLPLRCLLRLRHWADRQWSRLCRRCLVKILELLLKLLLWRLRGKRKTFSR
jgi:hypothetical protein